LVQRDRCGCAALLIGQVSIALQHGFGLRNAYTPNNRDVVNGITLHEHDRRERGRPSMRPILLSLLLLLMTACSGSGPGKLAADACLGEVNQRLAGKSFDLNSSSLAASAKLEDGAGDIWHLSTQVVFDRGLATEFTQNLNCRVRVDDGAASVLSLEFIWAMKDLKLPE
jgi:hypothetical protein